MAKGHTDDETETLENQTKDKTHHEADKTKDKFAHNHNIEDKNK